MARQVRRPVVLDKGGFLVSEKVRLKKAIRRFELGDQPRRFTVRGMLVRIMKMEFRDEYGYRRLPGVLFDDGRYAALPQVTPEALLEVVSAMIVSDVLRS